MIVTQPGIQSNLSRIQANPSGVWEVSKGLHAAGSRDPGEPDVQGREDVLLGGGGKHVQAYLPSGCWNWWISETMYVE